MDDNNDGAFEAREAYLARLAADFEGEPLDFPFEEMFNDEW